MTKFFKWFAGFFEDQAGSASGKRIVLFWAMALVTYMIIKGVSNMEMFWGVIALVITFGGYATSEFFKGNLEKGTQPEDPNDPRPR